MNCDVVCRQPALTPGNLGKCSLRLTDNIEMFYFRLCKSIILNNQYFILDIHVEPLNISLCSKYRHPKGQKGFIPTTHCSIQCSVSLLIYFRV